jgi:glycosyltransferase involved in cell wall biosynthesis
MFQLPGRSFLLSRSMHEMKILLICKHPTTGGAAIASTRLMKALQSRGVDVKMLVQEGGVEKEGIYSTTKGWIKMKLNLFRFIYERLVFLRHERSRSIRFLFSLANTGESIVRNRLVEEADIIHLHWINAGFLSLKSLKELLNLGKPVVWTFHDMWPFTGGCHYSLDCMEYTRECGHCPYLKKPGKRDLSHRIWKKKEKLFRNKQVTVITPSAWLGECVRESSLLHHWQCTTIHNPIDHELFKPVDRKAACRNLGLDPSRKYILFGAANVKNMLKGFPWFLEAIGILAEKYEHPDALEILLFGKSARDEVQSFPLPVREFAFVKSERTMTDMYSASHLFVIPSLQDNLPNTVLESMLCGTPVVGFRTGGIPELIIHRENGYLADYKSSADLAEGIAWGLTAESYEKLSERTRKTAVERFSLEDSVQKHLELYRNMINQVSAI